MAAAAPGPVPDQMHPEPPLGPRSDTAQRRPYPTAQNTTRLSPARSATPVPAPTGPAKEPVPATVWTFPADVPTSTHWPAAVVDRVLASFAPPGGTVAFLAWPDTQSSTQSSPGPGARAESGQSSDGISGAGVRVESDGGPGLAAARAGEPQGRTSGSDALNEAGDVGASGEDVDADGRPGAQRSDGDSDAARAVDSTVGSAVDSAVVGAVAAGYRARVVAPESSVRGAGSVAVLAQYTRAGSVDLVVTAAPPVAVDDRRADRVALFASKALRAGGILVVLTHSDWAGGALHDPTGTVVTAGQSADLLYLQHVVAVHRPLANNVPGAHGAPSQQSDGVGKHRRIHSDVLVLVQPHDHALDLPNAAAA